MTWDGKLHIIYAYTYVIIAVHGPASQPVSHQDAGIRTAADPPFHSLVGPRSCGQPLRPSAYPPIPPTALINAKHGLSDDIVNSGPCSAAWLPAWNNDVTSSGEQTDDMVCP